MGLNSLLQTICPSEDNSLTMSSVLKSRSFVHKLESWMISFGMSVFACLLERMILRSLKKSGAKP